MNLLVLVKRHYMGKDLIAERYGRYFEIPRHFVQNGANVDLVCINYRTQQTRIEQHRADGLNTSSVRFNLPMGRFIGIHKLLALLESLAGRKDPDVIWAGSDGFCVLVAVALARRLGAPVVADFYDNYDSYPATRMLLMRKRLIESARAAAGLTCVSHSLKKYLAEDYSCGQDIRVITNAISDIFANPPPSKHECRIRSGLPEKGVLIGYAGSMDSRRGLDTLSGAFRKVRAGRQDVYLVLVGRGARGRWFRNPEGVIDIGSRDFREMPWVYGSLDLLVVCNSSNSFGKYCFPQKLYEALASKTPVLVAAVSDMPQLLSDYPQCLYRPDDADDLAGKMSQQIGAGVCPELQVPSWKEQAAKLESYLDLLKVGTP